ncbi:hypothetical protein BC938DRAFT_477553 [Jimgerdemannia flammicorona]|uniref:Homeodomain-like protein n=1 Tax=Jimgerdemannia flammicorona TaxID=994334 RepID=A0A433QP78_9FUNG|nr:hypothetical protein BC938DRAFT_477553 [Jimgerdemannia flammicorona]
MCQPTGNPVTVLRYSSMFILTQRTLVQSISQLRLFTSAHSQIRIRWSDGEDRALAEAFEKYGNDWKAIAKHLPGRAVKGCKFRGLYGKSLDTGTPRNVHLHWTEAEDKLLREKIAESGGRCTVSIAKQIPNRKYKQVYDRWQRLQLNGDIKYGPWLSEETNRLVEAIQKHGVHDWEAVSKKVRTRTKFQCLQKYITTNPLIKQGKWSPAEDSALIDALNSYPGKWIAIASEVSKKTGGLRTNSQCRHRYINVLDPKLIKTPFSKEEDQALIDAFHRFGNEWTMIAQVMPTYRGARACKLRLQNLEQKGLIQKTPNPP